jgi:hypothetical protein
MRSSLEEVFAALTRDGAVRADEADARDADSDAREDDA